MTLVMEKEQETTLSREQLFERYLELANGVNVLYMEWERDLAGQLVKTLKNGTAEEVAALIAETWEIGEKGGDFDLFRVAKTLNQVYEVFAAHKKVSCLRLANGHVLVIVTNSSLKDYRALFGNKASLRFVMNLPECVVIGGGNADQILVASEGAKAAERAEVRSDDQRAALTAILIAIANFYCDADLSDEDKATVNKVVYASKGWLLLRYNA